MVKERSYHDKMCNDWQLEITRALKVVVFWKVQMYKTRLNDEMFLYEGLTHFYFSDKANNSDWDRRQTAAINKFNLFCFSQCPPLTSGRFCIIVVYKNAHTLTNTMPNNFCINNTRSRYSFQFIEVKIWKINYLLYFLWLLPALAFWWDSQKFNKWFFENI